MKFHLAAASMHAARTLPPTHAQVETPLNQRRGSVEWRARPAKPGWQDAPYLRHGVCVLF